MLDVLTLAFLELYQVVQTAQREGPRQLDVMGYPFGREVLEIATGKVALEIANRCQSLAHEEGQGKRVMPSSFRMPVDAEAEAARIAVSHS